MLYQLDPNIKNNPLYAWFKIFQSLSSPYFDEVYELLEFPFEPPDDLQQIAHDFAFTYMLIMQNPEYANMLDELLNASNSEVNVFDLLVGTSSD